MSAAQRALAGAVALVLVLAVGYTATRAALGAWEPRYSVWVNIGELGQGVVAGSDVKMRGVLVGEVGTVRLTDELEAVVELVLEPRYRVPVRARFAVTGKTLFGEKQVEVVFDGPVEEGPFVADGGLVEDPAQVAEVQDLLAELAELFDAVDPDDLAVLVGDGLGAFDGQAGAIARAVDAGARAADLGVSVLDDQVSATRDLSVVAESLGPQGPAFNRLAGELNAGLPTLTDNQEQLRVLLDELSRFASVLDATLEVDRANLDRLIVRGDSVTRMLFAYAPEVGELLAGLTSYTSKYGRGFEGPGVQGQAAYFQVFLREEGLTTALCRELPPELTTGIPACAHDADFAGEQPAAAVDARAPVLTIPAPRDLLRPGVPDREGVGALLQGALGG